MAETITHNLHDITTRHQLAINDIQATLETQQQDIIDIQTSIIDIRTSINHIIHSVSEIATKVGFQITLPPPLPLSTSSPTLPPATVADSTTIAPPSPKFPAASASAAPFHSRPFTQLTFSKIMSKTDSSLPFWSFRQTPSAHSLTSPTIATTNTPTSLSTTAMGSKPLASYLPKPDAPPPIYTAAAPFLHQPSLSTLAPSPPIKKYDPTHQLLKSFSDSHIEFFVSSPNTLHTISRKQQLKVALNFSDRCGFFGTQIHIECIAAFGKKYRKDEAPSSIKILSENKILVFDPGGISPRKINYADKPSEAMFRKYEHNLFGLMLERNGKKASEKAVLIFDPGGVLRMSKVVLMKEYLNFESFRPCPVARLFSTFSKTTLQAELEVVELALMEIEALALFSGICHLANSFLFNISASSTLRTRSFSSGR